MPKAGHTQGDKDERREKNGYEKSHQVRVKEGLWLTCNCPLNATAAACCHRQPSSPRSLSVLPTSLGSTWAASLPPAAVCPGKKKQFQSRQPKQMCKLMKRSCLDAVCISIRAFTTARLRTESFLYMVHGSFPEQAGRLWWAEAGGPSFLPVSSFSQSLPATVIRAGVQ